MIKTTNNYFTQTVSTWWLVDFRRPHENISCCCPSWAPLIGCTNCAGDTGGPKAPQVGQRTHHGTPWSCGKVHPWNPMDSNRKSASQWESNNLTLIMMIMMMRTTATSKFEYDHCRFLHAFLLYYMQVLDSQTNEKTACGFQVAAKVKCVCLHVFTEAGVDHFTIVSLEQWMKFGWQSQMHQYPTANGSRLSPTIIPLFFLQLVAPRWEMQVLPLDSLASTSSCSSCQRWHCFGLALDICWGTADSSLQYNNNPGTDAPWKHV